MVNKTCGPKFIAVNLEVKDDAGLVSVNQSTQQVQLLPPLTTSFALNVSSGETLGEILYNGEHSDPLGDHQWDFEVFLNSVSIATLQVGFTAVGQPVNDSASTANETITASGTGEKVRVSISGSGVYTIVSQHRVRRGGITCEEDTQSNQVSVTGGGGCENVNFPDLSTCATDPEVNIQGANAIVTWTNLKSPPECTPPVPSVQSTGSSNAIITWTSTGAQSYNIRYKLRSQSQWTSINNHSGLSYNITNLVSASEYEVQVQSNCTGNEQSDFSASVDFTTQQVVTGGGGPIKIGATLYLDTPLSTHITEDGQVPMQLIRIYANTINITSGANSGDNISVNPSWGHGGLNHDAVLESIASRNQGMIYCLEGAPWFLPEVDHDVRADYVLHQNPSDNPPSQYRNGELLISTSNYTHLSTIVKILAARWGNPADATHGITNPNSAALFSNMQGSKAVDLNVFRHGGGIQVYNEYDEHWEGLDGTYTLPAAMASDLNLPATETRKSGDIPPEAAACFWAACCDAAAEVNPGVPIYMGSGVMYDPNQYRRFIWWFDTYRGGSLPANGRLAMHHYQHEGGMNNPNYTQLIDHGKNPLAPEQGGSHYSGLQDMFEPMQVQFETAFPNFTRDLFGMYENGYDVDSRGRSGGSPHTVDPVGSYDRDEVQIMWMLRCAKIFFRIGMVEYTMYNIRDSWSQSLGNREGGLFATSGLMTGNHIKAKSWYMYMLFVRLIGGSEWVQEVASGDGTIEIDRFDKGGQRIYMIHKNTANDQRTNGYSFTLQSDEFNPVIYEMSHSSDQGNQSFPNVSGGAISLDVHEMPKFIVVDTSS